MEDRIEVYKTASMLDLLTVRGVVSLSVKMAAARSNFSREKLQGTKLWKVKEKRPNEYFATGLTLRMTSSKISRGRGRPRRWLRLRRWLKKGRRSRMIYNYVNK